MKHIQRILTLLACVLAMGALCLPAFAAHPVTATLSSDSLQTGETVTLTVSIQEVITSSLGVDISCDDALEIIDGKWLKSGLIASFDPVKNKGAFAPGASTALSGDIFLVTLRAKEPTATKQSISVTVIAKNGTATVLEETVTQSVSIACASHTFSDYGMTATDHFRSCIACTYVESGTHNWNSGTVTVEETCEQVGEKSYTCTVCDGVKKEAIPKLPHTPATVDKQSATCSAEGYTGDKICSVCDELLEKGSAIPKLPHTPATVGKQSATCSAEGYTGDKICSVCDELLEKGSTIAKTAHQYNEGACTQCGATDPNAPVIPETTAPVITTPPTPVETTAPVITTPPTPVETTAPVITTPPTPVETTSPVITIAPIPSVTTPPDSSESPDTGVSMDPIWKAGVVILLIGIFSCLVFKRKKAQ